MRVTDSISFPENQDVAGKLGSTNAPKTQEQSGVGFAEDATDFSPDLQKVENLKAQAANLPDIRQERVQELRKAVQSGTYEVSANKIADAMMTDLMGPQSGSN